MRTPLLLAGVILALIHLQPMAAGNPIHILQVTDLSGPNGDTGRDFVTGAQVYLDQLNAKGGIAGREVKLVVEDDKGEQANTVALSRKGVAQYAPAALFGYFGADNVKAVLADRSIASQGIPMVAPYVGINLPSANPVYYLRASSADELAKISRIATSSGLNRIALVTGDDALGRAAGVEIIQQLQGSKTQLVGRVRLASNSLEVDSAADTLASINPQAIILAAPTIASAAFVQAYQQRRPGTAFYALSWINPQTLQEFLGPEAARWVAISALVPSPYNPTSAVAREFVGTLKKYRDEPPSYASMEGYMAARMLVDALRKSGGDASPFKLHQSLASYRSDMGGVRLQLDSTRRRALSLVDLAVFTSGGRLVN
ncbi:branched chain amino acid ABC transporter substrate-binding protein [Chitinimonas prasina]|uniref:Branched chain amino acid ABC transporter substrate-binding protein n=1 Tax=Chitinimonas prasina TaxID=1434937 RepID=A0ABQ5Y8X7_9NEIS|nr:ABC transporter substrate-binding protein [Chitinimonas prasina]GLR11390.1 branched chain amino acid ABC transporter substrate-binding protein [Chitinimonas prasina]